MEDLGTDGTVVYRLDYLAQDMNQLRAVVNTVLNLRVP
jgi:hypothetical protein